MGKTNNFPGLKNETETETFNFGLMEPRPRPRLSFWVSWNRDRDRDFNMKSRETETFTRPDILSLGGTETGTETTKVSVPRVSAPRPPISDSPPYQVSQKKWMIAKSYFWGPLETVFSLLWYLEHLFRILGLVHVLKERFLCPYNVPYSPYKPYTSQILPLVHGLTLVSYISVPSILERSKQSLKAPKIGSLHVKHLNADSNQGQCNLVTQYKIDDRISCQREASSVSEKPSHLWFDWQGPISL